jgi:hypothetical protein
MHTFILSYNFPPCRVMHLSMVQVETIFFENILIILINLQCVKHFKFTAIFFRFDMNNYFWLSFFIITIFLYTILFDISFSIYYFLWGLFFSIAFFLMGFFLFIIHCDGIFLYNILCDGLFILYSLPIFVMTIFLYIILFWLIFYMSFLEVIFSIFHSLW